MSPLGAASAAILVFYGRRSALAPMLESLRKTVSVTVAVDNGATPDPALQAACREAGALYLHNANRAALAGAYNLALADLARREPPPSHVVFIDDDSDVTALAALLDDPAIAAATREPDFAAIAAAYRDRATGLRARYMRWDGSRLRGLPREFGAVEAVAFVINSMSLWSLRALQRLGPFDERLALDHIDTEMCLRAHAAGLVVRVAGHHEFWHSIGERKRFRFLGREMQAGGHGPARRWLIARNTIWLAKREAWRTPAFALLCLARWCYEVVGVLWAEDDKAAKLWALLRGALSGLVTSAKG